MGDVYQLVGVSGRNHSSNLTWSHFQFAEWCLDYGDHGCRTPDTPFSLFEGIFPHDFLPYNVSIHCSAC